ncbi:hypothetical protein AN2483.2 [Aspergillus nidulans FGSC A4]|uniref:Uncharacterized protein n=1 Tax=Emericella nidulans (strain FGSC A4 / ATCC 38163 / CBS 112.46 / NRRL 194 / M139) TaxID=227321 RepID=Q5BAE7_EMENI|nr:hypothetical protein [Aspergillus nidulans FGSC A4]EAA63801.1 hypothetical protein AN2483.2 [Aspergillus nidulans FGSC A4]CBF86946.1 TPA: conserved hypothetical protein [Aspergillus nidulans FGSC A4]|eukprot:XP_660087.1 hypothetical protein AN2483.2 [Aspergillus nidulans FGSC A4]
MAKGILGKSRSPARAPGISNPSLNYTDALPRNDLCEIQAGVSYSRPIHQVFKEGQHPGMSDKHNRRKKPDSQVPGFDFQLTSSPVEAEALDTHLGVDESMIGIALGSPRLLEQYNTASQPQRIPPPTPPDEERPNSSLQRKPSKWKKIGGLFKAKNAVAHNANKPFYQVQAPNDGPSQGSTHSIDYKPRRRAGTKTAPIENTELWPCLASENETPAHQQGSKPNPGSFLQVEIPQVEMERYSVMFGGLLNNDRPSLLARRSKTLDNLTIPDKEATKVLGTQKASEPSDQLRKALTAPRNQSQEALPGSNGSTPDICPKTQSHRAQASITSFLSATSIGSDDEPLLIQKFERIRTYAGMKEPSWGVSHSNKAPVTMTVPSSETSTKAKNLTIRTRELHSSSDSNSVSSTETFSDTPTVTSASSPILSPLSTTKSPPRDKNVATARTISTLPPPRTTSRAGDNAPIPTIEVSVARSVSVSKGKKQVLVPVRKRTPHLNSSNERLVLRRMGIARASRRMRVLKLFKSALPCLFY